MEYQEKTRIIEEFKSHYSNDKEAYFALCTATMLWETIHGEPLPDSFSLMKRMNNRLNKCMKRRINRLKEKEVQND